MSNKDDKSTLQVAQERLSALTSTVTASMPSLPSIPSSLIPGSNALKFPDFDDLPRIEGQPQGCLWGFFDKDGKKDEVGTLNLLTEDLVTQSSKEIKTGEHIQLDWGLENVQFPGFGRKQFHQKVIDLDSLGFKAFDDEIYINTQSGSQWDSLKHFAHQKSGMYYNGLSHEEGSKSITNGIHNWCDRGGIVGRGVLVDWLRWYEHKYPHGKAPSPVTHHEIPVSEIEETLKFQGTTTKPGDILLIRSGYVRWHNFASPAERKKGTQDNSVAIGLQANEATVRWLYDQHFACVGGDTVAFEAWPPTFESGWCLHEWLLVQWGTPIGEMWDLESLSKSCEKNNRWTFFLTSAPLNVRGGVGSPPGCIAIL